MTKLVEFFGGREKSITIFCSSHMTVFYVGYPNTARVCWKESSEFELDIAT